VSGKLHAPPALPPRKEPPLPFDKRLGEPQNRSIRCERENLLFCRNRNPSPRSSSS
jgi:hypothetical protein